MAKGKWQAVAGTRYHLHPAYAMEAAFIRNLPEKTGKSLKHWLAIIREDGPGSAKECVQWLKDQHGVSTNYARLLAQQAEGGGGAENYDPQALVVAMFAGKKAALLPLYEKLQQLAFALGDDVKACPTKTFVPLYRQHVFAQIKPTSNTRIDLGLALGDLPATGRLLDTGGFAKRDRITHRIAVSRADEIDAELVEWLARAYALDA